MTGFAKDARVYVDECKAKGYYIAAAVVMPSDHALLWISDMVAWCCHNGGEWYRRVQPMIADIRSLAP